MTSEEKAKTWAELARRDGDEEAADAIEALIARAEQAERERDAARESADDWKTCAEREIADRERAEADNAAWLQVFGDDEVQWARKSDWQGLCPLRNTHGCEGTDGRISAMGTPKPKPHGEHCPFRLLTQPHPGAALLERLRATTHALYLAMLYIGDRSAGSADVWGAAQEALGREDMTASEIIDALKERKP